MHVLITGGAGFLGRRLANNLLQRGTLAGAHGEQETIDRMTLLDVVPPTGMTDPRVTAVSGDVADPVLIKSLVDRNTTSIFHLAAIVSGMAEADFDLGMRVNLDASRTILEACRALAHRPRVVFTSSVAVFGGELPALVPEGTAVTPQSSYGTEKAMAELLVNDYSRRGFVDGRSLRLPTISVRPGRPNAALSSFASSIIREPLNGEEAVCPVDPDARVWLLSPHRAIECLIVGHEIQADALGSSRIVSLPGLSITVGEMVAALERVAGAEVVARIKWERDPKVVKVVATWPGALDATRAQSLGFPGDASFDDIVRRYIDDEKTSGVFLPKT
jgi:nucleoside-diphosphate-sugar epimerase